MSDSLTEIMKEMRNAPPPTKKELAELKAREALRTHCRKAVVGLCESLACAYLADDEVFTVNQMLELLHHDLRSALCRLYEKGIVVQDESWRWKRNPKSKRGK